MQSVLRISKWRPPRKKFCVERRTASSYRNRMKRLPRRKSGKSSMLISNRLGPLSRILTSSMRHLKCSVIRFRRFRSRLLLLRSAECSPQCRPLKCSKRLSIDVRTRLMKLCRFLSGLRAVLPTCAHTRPTLTKGVASTHDNQSKVSRGWAPIRQGKARKGQS